MSPAFATLFSELRRAHRDVPCLRDFVAFPDDLTAQDMAPRWLPCADVMLSEVAGAEVTDPLARAFVGAARVAYWRDTYSGTDIGADFMARFGCYCAIGPMAPATSAKMAGFVVTMPPGLAYPWHHHPAEEIYYVIAGEAEFLREGTRPERIGAGGHVRHASNQPHAMRTTDHPVMAYVAWRNHLDTPPVLTRRPIA